MKLSISKDFIIGLSLELLVCLITWGVNFIWETKPWFPYTEPDIQQALEVHYQNRNPRLGGIWDSYGNCQVVVAFVDRLDGGRTSMYVVMIKIDATWRVDYDVRASGLLEKGVCARLSSTAIPINK